MTLETELFPSKSLGGFPSPSPVASSLCSSLCHIGLLLSSSSSLPPPFSQPISFLNIILTQNFLFCPIFQTLVKYNPFSLYPQQPAMPHHFQCVMIRNGILFGFTTRSLHILEILWIKEETTFCLCWMTCLWIFELEMLLTLSLVQKSWKPQLLK